METTGTVGYAAMFEQFHPTDLLHWSKVAEESGFTSVMASDHFHPWTPEQGQSAFVWSWLGALGATTSMRFGTGVTPPGFRDRKSTRLNSSHANISHAVFCLTKKRRAKIRRAHL